MLIDVKPRILKPPWRVEVDWGHPLARTLRYALVVQAPALLDVAGRAPRLSPKSGASVGASRIGPALICNATSEGAEVATPPYLKFATWPVSLAMRFTVLGTPDVNASFGGVVYDNANSAPYISYGFYRASLPTLSLAWNDGTTFHKRDTRDLVVGETISLAGVIQGSDAELVYINGALYVTGSDATGTGPAYGATTLLHAGAVTGSALNPNIALDYLYIWDRVVTAAEAQWLAAEPYAPVRPVPAVRYARAPASLGVLASYRRFPIQKLRESVGRVTPV